VSAPDFDQALAGARAGEEWAWDLLHRWLAPSILGFLRGRIPSEAEDLAASVWMEAARGLAGFEGDEAGFRAWMFTIARRRMLNERRRQARRPVELYPVDDLPVAATAADPADEVAERAAGAAAVDLIREVLPELQGEVVLLRVVAELPVNDIAALLDLAPGHVRVLAHRGLAKLAEHFSRVPVTPGSDPGISEVP
jgi:RNA polymerase sigma-70 factor, ECF subfamily